MTTADDVASGKAWMQASIFTGLFFVAEFTVFLGINPITERYATAGSPIATGAAAILATVVAIVTRRRRERFAQSVYPAARSTAILWWAITAILGVIGLFYLGEH